MKWADLLCLGPVEIQLWMKKSSNITQVLSLHFCRDHVATKLVLLLKGVQGNLGILQRGTKRFI